MCSVLNDQISKTNLNFSRKLEYLQRNVCESCRDLIPSSCSSPASPSNIDCLMNREEICSLTEARLRQVEIELAEKKLALTEALCENQELARQLHQSTSTSKNETDRLHLSLVNKMSNIH